MLFAVLASLVRAARCKRPGLIVGAFAIGYAIARIFCELFREPDPQLGFLWGGLTMGMLLSVPLLLAGLVFVLSALTAAGLAGAIVDGLSAGDGNPPADLGRRPDADRAIYGALPDASAARLLRHARSARRGRRFHDRARDQPDVRRAARAVGDLGLADDGRAGKFPPDRARSGPRHHDARRVARAHVRAGIPHGRSSCISSKSARFWRKSSAQFRDQDVP